MKHTLIIFDNQQLTEQKQVACPGGVVDEVFDDLRLTIVACFAKDLVAQLLKLREKSRAITHDE